MIIAGFWRGPYDGQRLLLPCEPDDPWPQFVIPDFGKIVLVHFYLYSGWENDLALYLYDEPSLLTTA